MRGKAKRNPQATLSAFFTSSFTKYFSVPHHHSHRNSNKNHCENRQKIVLQTFQGLELGARSGPRSQWWTRRAAHWPESQAGCSDASVSYKAVGGSNLSLSPSINIFCKHLASIMLSHMLSLNVSGELQITHHRAKERWGSILPSEDLRILAIPGQCSYFVAWISSPPCRTRETTPAEHSTDEHGGTIYHRL